MAVPAGWVKTKLLAGDELGSTSRRKVDPSHDLAKLYKTTARKIVEGNDVKFAADEIYDWVEATGGKRQPNGIAVFTDNSVIYLPPGGPRPVWLPGVAAPTAKSQSMWLWGGLAGAGVVLLLVAHAGKKGHRSRSSLPQLTAA